MNDNVNELLIPGHSTRREWAVYVIIATASGCNDKKLYVGKVGDNRKGCNPVISRIGNHFSYNNVHSQLRNKLGDTVDPDYRVVYSTFGVYDELDHQTGKDRINELERQLNVAIQDRIRVGFELLNPYRAVNVSQRKKEERKMVLRETDMAIVNELAERVFV
jgi:hypothetical protein